MIVALLTVVIQVLLSVYIQGSHSIAKASYAVTHYYIHNSEW